MKIGSIYRCPLYRSVYITEHVIHTVECANRSLHFRSCVSHLHLLVLGEWLLIKIYDTSPIHTPSSPFFKGCPSSHLGPKFL